MLISMLLLEKTVINRAYRISVKQNKSVIGAYVGQYMGHVSKR